jgi:hypothetical protein
VPEQVEMLKEKVERYVADLIGPRDVNEWGEINFRWGSAHVFVRCSSFGDDESVVFISIPLLYYLQPSPDLFRYVAMHADDWYFGHLSVSEKEGKLTLWLTHSLLGDYLDVEELKTAVATMAKTADRLDDELKAKFGGERYDD